MAYTINGIGTTFYGKRDFRADGSFLTTEWVSLLYFPLFPLRSLRVRYLGQGERAFPIGVGSSDNYAVYDKTPPNLKQVIYVYGYAVFAVGWVFLIMMLCIGTKDASLALTLLFVGILVPIPIPWIFRHFAKKRAYNRHDA
jgi:hypothetical protein